MDPKEKPFATITPVESSEPEARSSGILGRPGRAYNRLFSYCFWLFALFLFFLQSLWNLSCTSGTAPEQQFNYPDSNLSFREHIRPIFLSSCANQQGCHISSDPAGLLDLETDRPTFTGQSGLDVVPFNPEQSLLYRLLLREEAGIPRMPLNQPLLPEAQIQAIRQWIKEGASVDN